MKGVLGNEGTLNIGNKMLLDSSLSSNTFGVFFEDDGDTGYFYALNTKLESPILDALHIYNAANVSDGDIPSKVQIVWSNDGLKSALMINDCVHAVFDFESERGYCRTGFPPINDWSKDGHEWSEKAIELFD